MIATSTDFRQLDARFESEVEGWPEVWAYGEPRFEVETWEEPELDPRLLVAIMPALDLYAAFLNNANWGQTDDEWQMVWIY